jgi:opacity protein-like surface antigen
MGSRAIGIKGLALGAALVVAPLTLVAQSAQPWSLQGSLFTANAKLGASTVGGAGFEAQLRYTPASAWSLGGGLQYTSHTSGNDELNLTGFFLEPRYALDIGSDRFAPYLAGRVAMLSQKSTLQITSTFRATDVTSNGTAFGAGAGLIVRSTARVNFDFGVAMVSQSLGSTTATNGSTTYNIKFESFLGYLAKAGISIGFGSR